jgi:hypothetical protein
MVPEVEEPTNRNFEIETIPCEYRPNKFVWEIFELDGSHDGKRIAKVYSSRKDAELMVSVLSVFKFIEKSKPETHYTDLCPTCFKPVDEDGVCPRTKGKVTPNRPESKPDLCTSCFLEVDRDGICPNNKKTWETEANDWRNSNKLLEGDFQREMEKVEASRVLRVAIQNSENEKKVAQEREAGQKKVEEEMERIENKQAVLKLHTTLKDSLKRKHQRQKEQWKKVLEDQIENREELQQKWEALQNNYTSMKIGLDLQLDK